MSETAVEFWQFLEKHDVDTTPAGFGLAAISREGWPIPYDEWGVPMRSFANSAVADAYAAWAKEVMADPGWAD